MAIELGNLGQSPVARQLGLMVGVAASVALGITVWMWGREPTYGVLYSGLSQKDAAAIVETLRQKEIKFKMDEVSGGIMVPSEKVHELRLDFAGAGLPQSAGVGFNILEQKQEFGTSQFMENARYQRALEEELARTISSVSLVESARVHLALPKQSVFVRKRQEPSASVLVRLYPGRTLEQEQVAAITHLVASSIPNLEPGRVTVVDQKGRLLSSEKVSAEVSASRDQFEHTRTIEESYETRIENILGPIVGPDGVRAQVSADLDFSVTEQTLETYNPDRPALRSEQRFEQATTGPDTSGVPGALSNEPPASGASPETLTDKGGGSGDGASGETRPVKSVVRSTANYELDHTISHTRLATGQVKRLSVAVVVDDKFVPNEEGQMTRVPRTPEELDRITSLVKEAVGYNGARGDTVNVVNASFTEAAGLEPQTDTPLWKQVWLWDVVKQIVAYLILAALIWIGLLAVIRSLGATKVADAIADLPPELADDTVNLSDTPMVHLPGPDEVYEANLNQARQMALQDPKRVAQVVRSWLVKDEK